jgi:hypothetical protein
MTENTKCNVIVFSKRAIEEIKKETFRKSPYETGGILLGKIIDDQWYVIATTEPGPNSIFEISYFEYDQDFVTKEANRISKEFENELELLGLWHRHPGSMDVFSRTDDGTNTLFAKLRPEGAISGIVNLDPDFRLTMYHVDLPLKYEKIEIFTEEELIPPEFLRLKPLDVIEKKEIPLTTIIEAPTSIDPNLVLENNRNKDNIHKKKHSYTKKYFCLFSLLNLILLFAVLWQVGNGKTVNDKPEYTLADKNKDLLKTNYFDEYEKKHKANNEKLFKKEIDSIYQVDKNIYIEKILTGSKGKKIDTNAIKSKFAQKFDSININFDSISKINLELQHNLARKKFISSKLRERVPYIGLFKSFSDKIKSKIPLILLVNLLVFIFLSLYNFKANKIKPFLVIGITLVIGVILFFLLPNMLVFGIPYIYKLGISFFVIWQVALIIIILNKVNLNNNSFWYEKKNSILETEKTLVNSNFPKFKLDNNEEDGRLFWHGKLTSIKGNAYHIQVVYDNDYNGSFNRMHTYFIDPVLSDLQVDNNDLPFTSLDSSNTAQLQFDTKDKKNTALYTIRLTEKWINNFESWLEKKISLKEFKNLKID